MAAPVAMKDRVKAAVRDLWSSIRDTQQSRLDVIAMGDQDYTGRVLTTEPSPAQFSAGIQAVAAAYNQMSTDGTLQGLLTAVMDMDGDGDVSNVVDGIRFQVKTLRERLRNLRQLKSDLIDAGGTGDIAGAEAWLAADPAIGATIAAKVVAVFAAVDSMDTSLNLGAGSRRKNLRATES
jgi:hypothetical protein